MYLRTVPGRTKKDGLVHYLQLAHNYRDPATGRVRARILFNFGRVDQVDRAALERLIASIRRFLEPTSVAEVRAAIAQAGLELLSARALGGCWLLDQLWRRLGLDRALEEALGRRAERAIFAMVANRALAPSSKLSVTDWLAEEVVLPGWAPQPLPEQEPERTEERKRRANLLYEAMDLLGQAEQRVQERVFWAISGGSFLELEVDLLFLDTTTTYWETEEEDEQGLRRRSQHSKDRRPDLPQIVLGLAVTRQGIPVRCWVWPGNTADVTVIEQVKRDLSGWRLGRVVTVIDRGFVSEENLRILQRQGGHYIAGERLRGGRPEIEAALARAGRYRRVREDIEIKEIVVGAGEARRRFVLVRNPKEAERDRAKREDILAHLREELAALEKTAGEEHTRRVCALRAHEVYGRYLTTDARGRLKIDQDKVRAEERLDGKYLIRTSDDTLSAEDVALGYRQLVEVEAAFRTLKTTLELRPVYHRLDGRIRAHVVLCWLALLLVRVLELKTGRTWPQLRREWQQMHLVEFRGPSGRAAQRTATTPGQRATLGVLGLEEPPLVWDLRPAGPAEA
jgi:transposase